jgi:protein phosphatase 1D
LPSTSGSTATVLFIKKSKAYVGHVGDSGLVIGYTKHATSADSSSLNALWYGKKLTRDHKPEDPVELKRIEDCGGSVMSKSGISRVVWNRPAIPPTVAAAAATNNHTYEYNKKRNGKNLITSTSTPYELNCLNFSDDKAHDDPVSQQTTQKRQQTERIPFLAVARSLGDLWSYNAANDEFIVSPVPDVFSFQIEPRLHKCLILATDGLWNVLKANECVELVKQSDKETENLKSNSLKASRVRSRSAADNLGEEKQSTVQPFVNPSQLLVNTAIQKCCERMIRADNTTCITIMIDQVADLLPSYQRESNEPLNSTVNYDKLMQSQNKSI